MPIVSIVIVSYNRKQDVLECLTSLSKLITRQYRIYKIVVDNASKEDPGQDIKQIFPDVTYLRNEDNLGFTGGNNTGISYALEHGADYVLVLNPDVYVDPLLVDELLKGFSDDKVGITVPKVYFAKGFEFHKDRYTDNELGKVIWYAGGEMDWDNIIGYHRGVDEVDQGQFETEEEVKFASGNCMMIKKEVIEKVGLFDDRYFLYYEDADFSMRVRKAGYTILYTPKAVLWHKNAQSAGGSGGQLQDYFISRNRLIFGFTYARLRTKMALVRESFRNLFVSRARRLAMTDYYTKHLGKGRYIT